MTANQTLLIDKQYNNNNNNNNNKLAYDTMKNIYMYKNDPKVIKKGVYISNFKHFEGGYLPMLHDSNYIQRKSSNISSNPNYDYDDKIHHGQRPMHKTTFSLSHGDADSNNRSNFITHNKREYQGRQLRPEYYHDKVRDQFKPNFHISNNDSTRNLNTHYESQFYFKNNDQEYKNHFDLMPKYSVPKKLNQLNKENAVKVYKYHTEYSQVKDALEHDNKNNDNYWTQYKRTHDYLGAKRGNGEPREFPSRPSYDIFSGEKLPNPSWSVETNFKRVSANISLADQRLAKSNILN